MGRKLVRAAPDRIFWLAESHVPTCANAAIAANASQQQGSWAWLFAAEISPTIGLTGRASANRAKNDSLGWFVNRPCARRVGGRRSGYGA